MQRFNRQLCFRAATLVSACMTLVAYVAIVQNDFWLFCLATFCLGMHIAFVQHYRFVAAESVNPEKTAQAISTIMLGGLAATFIGPEIAHRTAALNADSPYSTAFIALAILLMMNALVLIFYHAKATTLNATQKCSRQISTLFKHPAFGLTIAASLTGYGVMSYMMMATPISMHSHNGYSLAATTRVIQAHMIAMFLPSLFSGKLIGRFGERSIIGVATLLMMICVATVLSGVKIIHYSIAMVTLGLGWNFLFVGGALS